MTCHLCNGDLQELGQLGNVAHYRCRNCGMDFSKRNIMDDRLVRARQLVLGVASLFQQIEDGAETADADTLGAMFEDLREAKNFVAAAQLETEE